MPKMHRNTFGDRAPPGLAGELKRSPDPLAAVKGSYFEGQGKKSPFVDLAPHKISR